MRSITVGIFRQRPFFAVQELINAEISYYSLNNISDVVEDTILFIQVVSFK